MDLVSPKSKIFVNFVNFKVLFPLLILNCVFVCNFIFLNDPRWEKMQRKKSGRNQSKNRAKTREEKSSVRFRSQRGFLCENGLLLRNQFATLLSPLRKFS